MTTLKTSAGVSYILALTDSSPTDVPIWNPNALWKEWNIKEIYKGKASIGTGNIGRYVPNVGDRISDPETGLFVVTEVNTSTLIATWVAYSFPTTVDTGISQLLGVGPLYPQQGYFIYVDSTVTPPVMSFDSLLYTYQPMAEYVRVFAGESSGGSLEVLSARYDQSGNYVDDKIPLNNIVGDATGNYKIPANGYAKRAIAGDEQLIVIFYSANGTPTTKLTMTAVDSGLIRQSNSANREIANIEIISSYLSSTDKLRLMVPVNFLMTSIDIICRVTYSDGTTRDKPIDGNKIELSGLNEFIPTQVGQTSPLTLFYVLDSTESYQGTTTASRTISKAYLIETKALPNAYSVKLFMYPEWVDAATGYKLRFFMYNLDRLAYYDVTSLVEANTTSAIWDPTLYNTKQHMSFALDLSKVSPAFIPYRHVQSNDITLMSNGESGAETPWYVNFELGDEDYGGNLECRLKFISSQVWSVELSQGSTTQDEWLDRLYYRTHPLFDTNAETAPPVPTHFILQINNIRVRRPISNWNSSFTIATGGTVGNLALVQWVREVNGVDLQLGCSGLIIRQTLTS